MVSTVALVKDLVISPFDARIRSSVDDAGK